MAAVERRIFAAGRHQEIGYATQGGVAWKSKSYEYFYNLAAVTIAFVEFAGLYIGFKQQQKVGTEFDVLLTENHFLLSFMVVGAALLPPLLLLVPPPLLSQDNTGWLSQDTAWGGVSVLAAIPPLVWSITYPGRRYAATKEPTMPTWTTVLLIFLLPYRYSMHSPCQVKDTR